MIRTLRTAAVTTLLAATASAQFLHGTVGPDPAPFGCNVSITMSNDHQGSWGSVPCPFRVFDASMNLVFEPDCLDNPILIGPYGWVTATWPQVDDNGQQVPPGQYWVEVLYDGGFPSTLHPVTVSTPGGTQANLVLEGTATIGQTLSGQPRNFYLCAPNDGGYSYFLMASLSSTVGVPSCGGTLPLDLDPLLNLTLGPNTIFQNAFGTLTPAGTSKSPRFPIPPDPTLVGFHLESAFVVLDFAAPCLVRRISEAYSMAIIE